MAELIVYVGVLLLVLVVGAWVLAPDEEVATDVFLVALLWPVILPLVLMLLTGALLVLLAVAVGRRRSRPA